MLWKNPDFVSQKKKKKQMTKEYLVHMPGRMDWKNEPKY